MALKGPCHAAGTPPACSETALYEQARLMRSLYDLIGEAAVVSTHDDSDIDALFDFMVAFEVLIHSNTSTYADLKSLYSGALNAAQKVVGLIDERRIEVLSWKQVVTV